MRGMRMTKKTSGVASVLPDQMRKPSSHHHTGRRSDAFRFTRVSAAFASDPSSSKMNLSLPGFRDDSGNIFIPPTVRYVEKQMRKSDFVAREALPIWGDDAFLEEGIKFAYGSDHVRFQKSNVSYPVRKVWAIAYCLHTDRRGPSLDFDWCHTLGWNVSGSLSCSSGSNDIPTQSSYGGRYSRPARCWTGYQALPIPGSENQCSRFPRIETGYPGQLAPCVPVLSADKCDPLQAAPSHSAVLLYMGGTLPTGLDLSESQWRMVTSILQACLSLWKCDEMLTRLMQDKNLIPLIIFPSQGLMSGDPAKDAQSLRHMAHEGLPLVFCQSFDPVSPIPTTSSALTDTKFCRR